MRSVAWWMGAGLVALSAASVQAQGTANTCPPGSMIAFGSGTLVPDRSMATQDACQMAVDVFQVMGPQLGLALAGGNATLGRGSALGTGHFSLGLRANVFNGDLPDVSAFPTPATSGRMQRTGANALPSNKQILGLPTADAAVGVFSGVPLGLTNIGGVDLLLSATYVPSIGDSTDDVQIKPGRNLQIGYGVRVGLLQESLIMPGVSFTYLKRDLPTVDITGTSSNLDVAITDVKVKTSAYRIVASKSLLLIGIAAGVGQDRYDQSAMVEGTVKNAPPPIVTQTSDRIRFAQKVTRTNMFLDLSLNLPVIKFIGEVGRVTGGAVDTYNEFQTGRADKARIYGSVGIRVGI